jgi:hypothetical protein
MAGTNKIFKDLQDYAVAPPRGLYAKLWNKIKKLSRSEETLLHSGILPDTNNAAEPVRTDDEKILSGLQSYVDVENTPPPFDFKKISEEVLSKKETPVVPLLKKSSILFWGYRVAAAATITGIIFFIYSITGKTDMEFTAVTPVQKDQPTETVKIEPVKTTIAKNKDPFQKSNINKSAAVNKYPKNRVTGTTYISKSVKTNIRDNDFLFTLASFNYTQAEGFLADIKKDPKISLNKFSYVNISDKMAAFLKQLYAVNSKKKPTWKARRAKARLNKWKRKDEENFDTQINKNPLDILDISEFIFKN